MGEVCEVAAALWRLAACAITAGTAPVRVVVTGCGDGARVDVAFCADLADRAGDGA